MFGQIGQTDKTENWTKRTNWLLSYSTVIDRKKKKQKNSVLTLGSN